MLKVFSFESDQLNVDLGDDEIYEKIDNKLQENEGNLYRNILSDMWLYREADAEKIADILGIPKIGGEPLSSFLSTCYGQSYDYLEDAPYGVRISKDDCVAMLVDFLDQYEDEIYQNVSNFDAKINELINSFVSDKIDLIINELKQFKNNQKYDWR